MVKISQNLLFNPAQIEVAGVRLSPDNIIQAIKVFDFSRIMVTIDSVSNDSPLLTYIKKEGLEHYTNSHISECIEVSVFIPRSLFANFLKIAMDEVPENIFVCNFPSTNSGDIFHQHSFEELVIKGYADVFVSFSLDENAFLICFNKLYHSPKEILKRVKSIHFH